MQQLKPLRLESDRQTTDTRDIAAGPVHAGDEAVLDRVAAGLENDRYREGCRLCCEAGCGRGACGDDGDLTTNQIGCQCRQSVIMAPRPAVLDGHVAAVDKTGFLQALAKRCDVGCNWLG